MHEAVDDEWRRQQKRARDRAAAAACCGGARRHAEEARMASHAARPLLCALAGPAHGPLGHLDKPCLEESLTLPPDRIANQRN